jgi:hypothetical protein
MIVSHKKAHKTRSSGINRKPAIMDTRALIIIAIISLFLAGKSTVSSYRLSHVRSPWAIRIHHFRVNDRSFLHKSMGLRCCKLLIRPTIVFRNITVLLDVMPYGAILPEDPAASIFRTEMLVRTYQTTRRHIIRQSSYSRQ